MEQKTKDTFLLIDGSAIVHRAYHAMPFFAKKDGTPTGAVYGFFSMLLKVMHQLEPKSLAVAFDRPKPTFRQQMYVGYQAQRPKMESELSSQYQKIIEILVRARIATYAVDGYEADDVIGTLSAQFEVQSSKFKGEKKAENSKQKTISRKQETIILTGDRDMFQLVDEMTQVLLPIKGISEVSIITAEKVREKYGVTTSQFVDLKALQGDASDNYPGVKGVGPKTAATLIQEYNSIDNIYKSIDKIALKNKNLAQKLVDGYDACIMAQKLAAIVRDVPFAFDFSDMQVSSIEIDDFKSALSKEEFHTLPKRVDEVFQKDGSFNHNGKGQMKLL